MLTRTQRESFSTEGYLVVRQLCAESVLEPVRRVITRCADALIRNLLAAGHIDDLYADAPFAVRWALAARDYNRDPERPPLSRCQAQAIVSMLASFPARFAGGAEMAAWIRGVTWTGGCTNFIW